MSNENQIKPPDWLAKLAAKAESCENFISPHLIRGNLLMKFPAVVVTLLPSYQYAIEAAYCSAPEPYEPLAVLYR